MTPEGQERPLDNRTLLAYAAPAFALAMPTIPVYIHLPALYADRAGVGLAATGAVLLAARLFDTVTDPLVGIGSDRLRLPGGRRKPWIAIGAPVAAFALFKVLAPPSESGWLYLLGWMVVLYAGWTAVAIPYNAWGAELRRGYSERTRITSARELAGLLGLLAAGAIPVLVSERGGIEGDGLLAIAWATCAVGLVGISALMVLVPQAAALDRPSRALEAAPRTRFRQTLTGLVRNRPFLRLIAAWGLNGLANGLPAVLFLLYLEHVLGAGPQTRSLFILIYFLAAVVAIPIWFKLSRRHGKHQTWCAAMLMATLAFSIVPVLDQGDQTAFFLICIVTGAALGADLSLPPALQADVVDYGRLRDRSENTGLYFALWGTATKLSLALAAGIGLGGVELLGFDPARPSAEGRQALVMIYAVLPIVFKLSAIGLVWRFPITRHRQRLIRQRLDCLDGRSGERTEL